MPRRAAVDALIGAGEGERAVLDQIALLGILPVAEVALGRRLSTVGRPAFTVPGSVRARRAANSSGG